jgi:adenosylhomocysteine nucleosidase
LGDVKPVIAVTGTKREAAVLAKLGMTVIAGGGDAVRLQGELARLAQGAAGLVSFGMAGAIDGSIKNGDWVIGSSLTGTWTGECDQSLRATLAECIPQAHFGPVYADGGLIADPAEKLELGHKFGALAADMESHVVAQFAAENGIPFGVIRCISDEANAPLPPAIAVAMLPDGGLAIPAILGSILQQPAQLPELIRCMRRFNHAFSKMQAEAKCLEPLLRFGLG